MRLPRFTRRQNGTLMATFRPAIAIGLDEIVFALYKSDERPNWRSQETLTKRGVLKLAVDKQLEHGTFHIEDDIDEAEWNASLAHALQIFPELKP